MYKLSVHIYSGEVRGGVGTRSRMCCVVYYKHNGDDEPYDHCLSFVIIAVHKFAALQGPFEVSTPAQPSGFFSSPSNLAPLDA